MFTNEYCRAKICQFLTTSCLVLLAVIVIFGGSSSWAMALRLSPTSGISGEVNQKLSEDSSQTVEKKEFEFEPKSGILGEVNQKFHDDYNKRIKKIITSFKNPGGPTVLVLISGNLTVYHNGKIKEHQFTPALFHKLKAIDHHPISLYMTLQPYEGQKLTDEEVEDLRTRKNSLEKTLTELKTLENLKIRSWYRSILVNQQSLLEDSIAYIDKVLVEEHIDSKELNNYVNQVRPKIVVGINLAAAQELEFLNDKIKSLQADGLLESKGKSPYVVICSVHQARHGEIITQYFEHVFNEFQGNAAEREDRIVYAESIFDNKEDKALRLLAAHILDQEISLGFFGEEKRLQRDALMDAASFWLWEHAMEIPKLTPAIKTKE